MSGHTNFLAWNSCNKSISFLSALAFYRDLNHKLPAMVVSCFVNGMIFRWSISAKVKYESFSVCIIRSISLEPLM